MTLVGLAARKLSIKKRNAKLAAAFPNGVRCQKCLELGHWSYECKEKRKYVHRTSRTKHLKKHMADTEAAKVIADSNDDSSKHATVSTKKLKAGTSSNSDSQSSSSDGSGSTDSDEDSSDDSSSSGSDSDSSSSGSDSESSSSESSDSSSSDDDEETAAPKKKKSRQSSGSLSSSSDNEDDI